MTKIKIDYEDVCRLLCCIKDSKEKIDDHGYSCSSVLIPLDYTRLQKEKDELDELKLRIKKNIENDRCD